MAYLWGGMLLIGIVYGVLAGNVDEVTKAFVSCSGEAVSLCISMAGITAMWTGMMKIAENWTGHGAGGKNETAAPFSVSEAGYRVKSGALYMS